MEDYGAGPKPVMPVNYQIKSEQFGYGNHEIWGNNATANGKRWMDTLVNMILEGPTKFLNRKNVVELYDASLIEQIQKWQIKQWGDQRFTGEEQTLSITPGTAHADDSLDLMGKLFMGVTAGAGEAQSAGKDHIDWMLNNGGAANFNHIFSKWGSGNADWASVYKDMPIQGINKWDISGVQYGDVNQNALPVEIFAEFFGRVNGLYGIGSTSNADGDSNGINADFADYGKLFSGARSFVEGQLNKAKTAGGYDYTPSFYELALSKENNAGNKYKTQEVANGDLIEKNDRTGNDEDDYNKLFVGGDQIFKLALTMLESRRRYWQALTLMMYSYRALEASYNEAVMQAAVNDPSLLTEAADYKTQNDLAAAKNHSAKLGIDPATIDWWDDVKSNQVYKEAGEFNKKFLQFIYSFQHKMVNTLEVYFNPAVCGSIDANDSFGLDDNRDGIFNDNNKYKVSTYFMYPFDRDEHVYYQDEIENIGIFNFNYYILKGLKDYQKGPGSYQLTVCDQYIDDYDSSIKDFVDFYTDKSTKSNEEDFSQWKEDKCAQIMNLLNALESDSSFINTIKIKAWRKELMKSGYGILDNEGKRNQLRAELEYAIKKGGGLREFRAEFQLGRSAWGIDPYSDLSDDEKTNFGITPKSLAYQRQPRSGDEQNWDMTYGFARFGGQGYHTQHVANLFTNMSTGSIKGITKNDLMLKGVFKEGDGTGKVNKNGLILQNDLVNATNNNQAFFGGSYKSLYNTVGLFRMKADIISYDRMLNIMCSSIYNFNRSNKADYKKRLEDWKDRKDMFERDEMLAEKIRQKSLQESSKTMQLIKIAGKKQDQEYKKRGQAIAKAKYKKEDKKHEFVNLISNMQSAKKKEKSKEIAKEKAHKTDSQKQNPQSKAAIKQFVMKNMKKKAKA